MATEIQAVRSRQSWWARNRLPYFYILPSAIVLAIVTFYPIFYEVYLSFTNFSLRGGHLRGKTPDWIWFRNYERIFKNELPLPNFDFWRILGFNVTWTIVNVFFHVVIGVGVAMLLNRPGIIGRKAGQVEGFTYSDAMKNSGLTWDEATLDTYLTAPKKEVPGNKMAFPGLPKPDDRANVIAYLKQASQ